MPRLQRPSGPAPTVAPARFELEVIPGLEDIAVQELQRHLGRYVTVDPILREGLIPFGYRGEPVALLDLATVLAVYRCEHFTVPRPKALLGQAAFDRLLAAIQAVRALQPHGAFQTFRISAAGESSSVLQRLREQIAAVTGMSFVADEGDLLLRLRRPLDGSDGWEVLVRLSPRPLSSRRWRVCNFAGALNASVAHAMALLTQPDPDDVVLNVGCGSGSLVIERLRAAPARIAIGCDRELAALACTRENLAAAGLAGVGVERWDGGNMPVPAAWVDTLLVDLPFGQLVGSHQENTILYPRLLREAARVVIGGGVLAAITQDIKLWERLVADSAADWTLRTVLPIKLPFTGGYLYPRIYVLQRKG